MQIAYGQVLVFLMVAIGFVLGTLALGWLVRPDNPTPQKLMTYECGEVPVGRAWFNFNPRFYVIGLIFLIFDVEVVFMYPIATVFRDWVETGRALVSLSEIFVFVAILLIALAYVWRKGDLDWIKTVQADDRLH